jgi:oligopeptide/dipeptide ABC transporter ATP-binding protein
MTQPVISITNLKKRFNLEAGFFARFGRFVYAVNDVSIAIGRNETYGLVGESGCGKTTTARLLVRMYEADEGAITFSDHDENAVNVRTLKGRELKQYRQQVKYVFQDPARSLNPRMSIFDVLASGPRWPAGKRNRKELWDEAAASLEEVGLSAADLERRPAEFSGGQRQRISIARGLLMRPNLLICDEVVSALDVSIQGQILNLLQDIRGRRELSFLFIAHDLKVACYFCDRIGVMYRGELMEEAPAAELYHSGLHPYTELLFSSVAAGKTVRAPRAAEGTRLISPADSPGTAPSAAGEVSPLTGEAQGCAFASRCPRAGEQCRQEHPPLRELGDKHLVRCFKV